MGNLPSRAAELIWPKKPPLKLCMIGLDCAGKTSILYKLARGKQVESKIPSIGFNVEDLKINGTVLTAFDIGGRSPIRQLALYFSRDTEAIVLVIDSADHSRFVEARDELFRILHDPKSNFEGKPLLILCNKQDLPNALAPDKISERLGIREKCGDRKWLAIGCSAVTSVDGLYEGIKWVSQAIEECRLLEQAGKQGSKHVGKDENDSSPDPMSSLTKGSLVPIFGFDPTEAGGNLTLQRFQAIKNGTECPFAKSAKLWGGRSDRKGVLTLEEQARANAEVLTEFVRRSDAGHNLDGFCIELDDQAAREGGPEELGACVLRMMTALSDLDPSGEAIMRASYIGARGWRFRFCKADFFVTIFAPCYPLTSSRYAFGSGRAFLLLQPEASFVRHKLPFDTPKTNWDAPSTVRDKTRVAFRDAGRSYHIPATTQYPMADHIVKPLHDDGTEVVRWWNMSAKGNPDEEQQEGLVV